MKRLLLLILVLSMIGCEKNDFELSENADEFFFLRNNGADMPLWVKGNTASKVFIINLHGGPGARGSMGDLYLRIGKFVETITSNYALVLWDQRNSGSSQGHYDEALLNESQFVDDLNKLIILLKNKYGSDIAVFLYGVSWGGYLGTAYITTNDHQYNLKGWINDSGNHNILVAANSGRTELRDFALLKINANDKNKDDWQKIYDWCNNTDTIQDIYDLVDIYNYFHEAGQLMRDSVIKSASWDSHENTMLTYFSPYSFSESFANSMYNNFVADNYKTLNHSDDLHKVKIPVLLMKGKYDFSLPISAINEAYDNIGSDIKIKAIFNNSGHGVADCETGAVLDIMINFIEANK